MKKENQLIISQLAEEDLKDAKEFYNSKKEGLGDELVSEIDDKLKRIVNNPKQYPKVKKDIRKALTNRFSYGIYFVFKDYIINVLSIFHTSRNPDIWKRGNI